MKISFNWLRELCDLKPGVTADSVAEKLSLAGLEVEAIDRRGRDLTGVVVAEVLGKRPHPSADTLSIVRLVAGGAEEEVVCGAPERSGPRRQGRLGAAGRHAAGRQEARPARDPRRDVAGDDLQRDRAGASAKKVTES